MKADDMPETGRISVRRMAREPRRHIDQGVEPRKKPQQRRSQEMVQRILFSAKVLLKDDGFEALTTANIAERAGLSVGSLYQYFPNKEAIVLDLARDWHAQFRTALSDLEAAPPSSGWAETGATLAAILQTMAAIYRDHRDLLPALEAMRSNVELRRIDREHDAAIVDQLCRLFVGINPDIPLDVARRLGQLALASVHACLVNAVHCPDETSELMLRDILNMVEGLLKPHLGE